MEAQDEQLVLAFYEILQISNNLFHKNAMFWIGYNITSFSTPYYHRMFDSPYQNKLYSGISVNGVALRVW